MIMSLKGCAEITFLSKIVSDSKIKHLGASIKDVQGGGVKGQPKADTCGRGRGSEANADVRKMCDF